ncbi:MAG: FAD-binding oxidoreductase [Anaerolineales bacterium]
MSEQADVVVIGGGIVGAVCAYYLTDAGLDVHLVEGDTPASGTSRACDGLILMWDKTPGVELALGLSSAQLWSELSQCLDLDFGYARCGTILLAEGADGFNAGQATADRLRKEGVRVEVLDPRSLRSLEPNLAPDLAGGVLFPEDANIDPRRATLALLDMAQKQGLRLQSGARVQAIRRQPKGDRCVSAVITGQGEIATEIVVCAAGVWSNQVASYVRLDLPVRPRKGHILVTARAPEVIRHALLEGAYTATVQSGSEDLGVALVAEATSEGNLLLGSSRQFAGFDRSVDLDVICLIAARAVRFLPALELIPVIRSYAGLRPWSPDHLPLVGPCSEVPGFYLATGHEGAGIGLAPVTGKLIAGWISGAELPDVAQSVRPDRFKLICETS